MTDRPRIAGAPVQLRAIAADIGPRHPMSAAILRLIADDVQRAGALAAAPGPDPTYRCSAHGDYACTWCARTVPGGLVADTPYPHPECSGCGIYAAHGVHWDTCPNRIRSAPVTEAPGPPGGGR